ncbi:hypothetical protein AKO1_002957 [Acrasis kona]|uniref:Uncharacterized protein n=1 Tax=Acrasis kona TaxID=1008807 RepID=A0AAW2Z7G9_9EUKA
MAAMRQCLSKIRDNKDEWSRLLKCKVCVTTGSDEFERYYDDFKPRTKEWLIKKIFTGIKRSLRTFNYLRASDQLKSLRAELTSLTLFSELETHDYCQRLETKFTQTQVRVLLHENKYEASQLYFEKNQKTNIELEIKLSLEIEPLRQTMSRVQKFVNVYHNDKIRLEESELEGTWSKRNMIWKESILALIKNKLFSQASILFTTHGISVRFPRIDVLMSILHISVMLDLKDTLSAYLSRLDTSNIPKSQITKIEFFKACKMMNDIEMIIQEINKGMRVAQHKLEVQSKISELNTIIHNVIQSRNEALFNDYESQLNNLVVNFINIHSKLKKYIDEQAFVKFILSHWDKCTYALEYAIQNGDKNKQSNMKSYYNKYITLVPNDATIKYKYYLFLLESSELDALSIILQDASPHDRAFFDQLQSMKRAVLRSKNIFNTSQRLHKLNKVLCEHVMTLNMTAIHWKAFYHVLSSLNISPEVEYLKSMCECNIALLDGKPSSKVNSYTSSNVYSTYNLSYIEEWINNRLVPSDKSFIETETDIPDEDLLLNNDFKLDVLKYLCKGQDQFNLINKITLLVKNPQHTDFVVHNWCLSNGIFLKRYLKLSSRYQNVNTCIVMYIKEVKSKVQSELDAIMMVLSQIHITHNKQLDPLFEGLTSRFQLDSKFSEIIEILNNDQIDQKDCDPKLLFIFIKRFSKVISDNFDKINCCNLLRLVLYFYSSVLTVINQEKIESTLSQFYSVLLNNNQKIISEDNKYITQAYIAYLPHYINVLLYSLQSNTTASLSRQLSLRLFDMIEGKLIGVEQVDTSIIVHILINVNRFTFKERESIYKLFQSVVYKKAQFLIDLSILAQSLKVFDVINDYTVRCYCIKLFNCKLTFDSNELCDAMLGILSLVNSRASNVDISINERGRFVLKVQYSNNQPDQLWMQVDLADYYSSTTGSSLLLCCSQQAPLTEQFICIGTFCFSNRNTVTTLKQVDGDPTQYISSLGVDTCLLQWSDITRIKNKTGGESRVIIEQSYLYDEDWYKSSTDLIRDIAYLCISGWLIGLCNRNNDTTGFIKHKLYEGSLGHYANSTLELYPFRDYNKVYQILRDGRSLFSKELLKAARFLMSQSSSLRILHAVMSTVMVNSYVGTVETIEISSDKEQSYSAPQNDYLGRERIIELVNDQLVQYNDTQPISRFEDLKSERNPLYGDPYLLKLIKRKARLLIELSSLQTDIDLPFEQNANVFDSAENSLHEKKIIENVKHVPISTIMKPELVLKRLNMRLNYKVVTSWHDDTFIHCDSVEELVQVLKSRSEMSITSSL